MQSLDERFGDKKVTGGNLDGTEFKKLTVEQLKRAARRYPSDSALRKYARAKLTIVELEGNEDPLPCAPLRPNQVVCAKDATVNDRKHKFFLAVRSIIWELLVHPIWKYVCLLALLMVVAKPSIMHVATKYLAKIVRLALREVFHFCMLLLEGLADEVIYQIDYTVRSALPPNMDLKDALSSPGLLVYHILSAGWGAGMALLVNYIQARRHIQA